MIDIFARVKALRVVHGHLDGAELIRAFAAEFPGSLGVISSFGAEAAVLLDQVAQVDPSLPVIFIDTDELFDETHAYRESLSRRLGLTGLRIVRPTDEELREADGLWRSDIDACCTLRKVRPFDRVRLGFEVIVDGRKRAHGRNRAEIHTIEAGEDGIIKLSPLAKWDQRRIDAAFEERGLPRHPLVAEGYLSIGCWPCTRPVAPGGEVRSGRWAGSAKSECGIHRLLYPDATI